jgi:hypothetical protein
MTSAVVTTTTTSRPLHLPAAIRSPPSPPLVARAGGRRRRAVLRCAAVSELTPAVSAAYGALLVGGGAFACAFRLRCYCDFFLPALPGRVSIL